jgi:hypothetical protein
MRPFDRWDPLCADVSRSRNILLLQVAEPRELSSPMVWILELNVAHVLLTEAAAFHVHEHHALCNS